MFAEVLAYWEATVVLVRASEYFFSNGYFFSSRLFNRVIFVITKVSLKFCSILKCVSLLRVYHVTEAVQVVVGTRISWEYCGSWCADTLCIVSLRVWF